MKCKKTLIAAYLLLSANLLFSQDGTKFIGYDALTLGRGGTVTGFFNNNTVLQTNPAGISFLQSSGFEFGMSGILPNAHFKNSINDTSGKKNVYPMGTISYVCKPVGKWSYGIGIFTEGGAGADFMLNHQLYKDPSGAYIQQSYHSKFAVLEGGASAAYKFTDKFSIGATAQLVYSNLQFGAPLSLDPSLLKGTVAPGMTYGDFFKTSLGYSELTATASNYGLNAFGFSGKLGLAYKPNDKISFGLNYTSPTTLNYKNGVAYLDLTTQFSDAIGRVAVQIMQQYPGMQQSTAINLAQQKFATLGFDLSKGVTDFYNANAKMILPQSLAIGTSVAFNKKLRIGLDAEWINWANAFTALDINLSNGTNPNINKTLGTNGTISFPFPLEWKNALVIRTGGEYCLNQKVALRAGYMYGSNPIPSSTVFPDFPAVIQHHATVGASFKLSKVLGLNLAYEHGFKNTETASSQSLLGSQYNNSQTSLSVNVFHASVSWRLK